ncbi:MAG: class I SAM-dependent methyltransferase [Bacteroidetes bacterium HGW-Bacteroidetes-6]|jgi:ubiquinone/menaquinone biosynthesis C-methylase UbiE|nr:MAG: class I SAM-dependent methyltransferase [Bacteroidetes bacterium HGW-Bacteroidetes-6]
MTVRYDKIGMNYDQTRRADNYISERFVFHLKPEDNKQYLDLGCGTGNYTIKLFEKGISIIGIDPSETMILKARSKLSQIDWIMGTAEHTGLNNNSIDGLICCLTIHHWTDLSAAFREIYRILKKNGKFVIFTSTPNQMEGYWLNYYFPQMLKKSREQMPSLEILLKVLKNTGFDTIETEKYFVSQNLQDYFLYCGKQRPELYLKPEIRNGISSFADLANTVEIENGLFRLSKDIDSGYINSIIDKYENEKGDYMFVTGTKASG